MKIIKKSTIPVQVCKTCGCTVKIKTKDLELDDAGKAKTSYKCPICWTKNDVMFKEEQVAYDKETYILDN